MDRSDAFKQVEALLEAGGREDLLVEVRRALHSLEAYETHGKTISEVTRALLESEKTYRLVFSHELDPMSLFDPATGMFLDVNDSWVRLYGYSRDEALAMKVTEVSAEPAQTQSAIKGLPAGETTRIHVRWHRAKDGTVFPVELTAGKLVLEGREVTYAVMRDITQRHRAEHALARSESSYRALIESMPDGVIVHRQGMLVYMSPSARRMLGYSLDEDVTQTHALQIVHPDDRAMVIERVRQIYAHGTAVPLLEERLLRRDGTHVVVEIGALNTVFDGEPAVLAIARDISARKEIEAQLVMNDRLASLGRLAASVGHELNNPLAYVLGNVGFMERDLARAADMPAPFVERFRTYVKVVGEGARRMRDIVHDLKTLARGDEGGASSIDLHHLLDVCANMAEHELRARTKLVKDYRDPVTVFGVETRLGQVFLNLLVNAGQAIPEGNADANEVRLVVRADGDRAVVEVSDTGTGIPRDQLDRIFEPFFTTKEGVGTGLGLSISHRIVAAAGGTLTCEARAGGGTTFRVTLPSAGVAQVV
ncbi:MAG: Sensory box histidine kinase/response regulator [Myxococcaceae bacterium]|nr:Sensory box histidine kinase/response regulator [Myxococcaceae bacterium]